MRKAAENKGVQETTAGGSQCPQPRPCGDGWLIYGKGVYADVAVAYYCKTHGRSELITVPPKPEPVSKAEAAVIAEHAPLVEEAEKVEADAEAVYVAASKAWFDKSLELSEAENQDANAAFSADYGWKFPTRRPDLHNLRTQRADLRAELDRADDDLRRARHKAHLATARAEQARRVARDKEQGHENGWGN